MIFILNEDKLASLQDVLQHSLAQTNYINCDLQPFRKPLFSFI